MCQRERLSASEYWATVAFVLLGVVFIVTLLEFLGVVVGPF